MMYYKYSDEELRSICRTHIENFEKWSRIFIHQILKTQIDMDYFHAKGADGNYVIKKVLVEKADRMMADEPTRFPTALDTLFLEDIIYLLCKPEYYKNYFAPYLSISYPEGKEEMKTFLDRLIPIRNKLSHTNPFSIREAEQCVCYCNDFIDCIKNYFTMTGQGNDFNVPTIIRVSDSLGNEYITNRDRRYADVRIVDKETGDNKVFRRGDRFSITLVTDPSFSPDSYTITWFKKDGVEILEEGKKVVITIVDALVGEETILICQLKTKNLWHRYNGHDHGLAIKFKAVP